MNLYHLPAVFILASLHEVRYFLWTKRWPGDISGTATPNHRAEKWSQVKNSPL